MAWRINFARLSILALFIIITVLQLFSFPGQFNYMRQQDSIELFLQIALTSLVALWLFAAQYALISIWKILNYMQKNEFFTVECFSWVTRIVATFNFASAVPVGLIVLIAPQSDDPGVLVMLLAILMFLLTLAVVMSLFRDQIQTKLPGQVG